MGAVVARPVQAAAALRAGEIGRAGAVPLGGGALFKRPPALRILIGANVLLGSVGRGHWERLQAQPGREARAQTANEGQGWFGYYGRRRWEQLHPSFVEPPIRTGKI